MVMIAVVVNTFNEEKNIERCLSSVSSFADDIVVVDMGSRDKTLDIAREFKAKIFKHPFTGFVEPARNFAIEKANADWILLLDADEEIHQSLKETLIRLSKSTDKSYFRLPRKNIIFGKWIKYSLWWPDYQIRFFKKGAVSWSDKIHSIPLTRGVGGDLEAVEKDAIIHYNYQTTDQFIERLNRYSGIQAKELYLSGYKFNWRDLIIKPTHEFINRYFEGQGYKDGIHGLALAFLQSLAIFTVYAKIWELEGFTRQNITLEEVGSELKKANRIENYWLISQKLTERSPLLTKIRLKLERKFFLHE